MTNAQKRSLVLRIAALVAIGILLVTDDFEGKQSSPSPSPTATPTAAGLSPTPDDVFVIVTPTGSVTIKEETP